MATADRRVESVLSDKLLRTHLGLASDSDALVDNIVLEIGREIIEGTVPAGTIVDSISLARRFTTSRTPVREALIALERHGLIEIEPRRRPRVSSLTSDQVTEVYELRAVLHGLIARKVALRRDDDDLLLLEHSLQLMRDAADTNDYFWSQVQFHDLAADIARDATLKRVTYGLGLQVLRLRRTAMGIGDRQLRSLRDHERLLVAYRESDADLALALGRSLVLDALTLLKRHERV